VKEGSWAGVLASAKKPPVREAFLLLERIVQQITAG
jgi:hypothetical protein